MAIAIAGAGCYADPQLIVHVDRADTSQRPSLQVCQADFAMASCKPDTPGGAGGPIFASDDPGLAKDISIYVSAHDHVGLIFTEANRNACLVIAIQPSTIDLSATEATDGTACRSAPWRTASPRRSQLGTFTGLAFDAAGDLYLAEGNRVRTIAGGTISTIAGASGAGSSGDYGAASSALVNGPGDLAVDGNHVVVADSNNACVREVW
jgi:hypothetical protein